MISTDYDKETSVIITYIITQINLKIDTLSDNEKEVNCIVDMHKYEKTINKKKLEDIVYEHLSHQFKNIIVNLYGVKL